MLQVFFRRGDFPSGSWEAAAALGAVTGDARPAHVVTTVLSYRHPSLHKSAFTSHFLQNDCARPPGSPLLWFCSSSAASHSCISNVMQNTLRCTLIIHGLVSRQSRFLFFNCSPSGTRTSADSPSCFVVLLYCVLVVFTSLHSELSLVSALWRRYRFLQHQSSKNIIAS